MNMGGAFGRWRTAALMMTSVLFLAGLVAAAAAISPIVSPPIKWGGGWEARLINSGAGMHEIALVPAGRNLMVTDIIATGLSNAPVVFSLHQGSATCASDLKDRVIWMVAPPAGMVHIPFETGVGFPAGQRVCLSSGGNVYFNFRGFFFTAAP